MHKMIAFLSFLLILGCQSTEPDDGEETNPYIEQLKSYWYNGEAELSSYELKQARYGEVREGKSVLIFVTEPFSPKTMTKADNSHAANVSVLKLNNTRNFLTGIYPYSMMTSTFFPFPGGNHSMKVSTSSQEWCGHTYLELTEEKGKYHISNHSYFQSEAQKELETEKAMLEDDLWTMIRLNPDDLPTGEMKVIPSFFYLRLSHEDIRPYTAKVSVEASDTFTSLNVEYPELDRFLTVSFESNFPFRIIGWEETYFSGWGQNRKKLTTSGKLIKTIRSQYWQQNAVADTVWRNKLGLE